MASAFLGSFLSAMATVLGVIPILFVKRLSELWKDVLVAFTAGIMVSATTFGLMPQAIKESGIIALTLGLITGVLLLDLIESHIPHIDVENKPGLSNLDSKALLVMIALFIHNIPEGLSTGFSYASEQASLGPMVAIAIGAQNMPEGLILAIFLMNARATRRKALTIAFLTGLMEMVSAVIGYFTASYVQNVVGYGLAFAAGAMLFIVYKELIPESHGHGYERPSTYSFIFGLLAMVYITTFFGG
ncbi:dihydroorotate dehydrogenase [Paenibacillus sp. IHB B 3415]|uniref:ZIP family metal transporter n=1 Tax=Paenibacillus sp. IHB B 3415 TaxID=867080 RepID=UPI000573E821|nr:ZIP family metal transporter [Paenibacillus sp. IHB B 3415]KHL94183.1 dihydroorotate dehydrogenase [Paenibacillus sp. IHB B 3415]